MENLYYYNLCREVPETAQKRIQGGRMSGMTDINPMWRIKKLTEIFGPCGMVRTLSRNHCCFCKN